MSLTERSSFRDQIIEGPPRRLDLGAVVLPEEVEITFVGNMHDVRFSNNEYLEGLFESNDVLVTELFGWTEGTVKRTKAIAKKSYNDLLKQLQNNQSTKFKKNDSITEGLGAIMWDDAYYKMLYKAKKAGSNYLRVLACDYPEGDPEVLNGNYDAALSSFSIAVTQDEKPKDEDLIVMTNRDIYIAQQICTRIVELRAVDERLKHKRPLRVIMPYGSMHFASVEAIADLAQLSGVDSFHAVILFEEIKNQKGRFSEIEFDNIRSACDAAIVSYQNWLRTPLAQ